MLRYITAKGLRDYPVLTRSMFRDRAWQFRDRLGWDVQVDANGEERDIYDACDPLYVIWQRPDGRHGGSMRFLPTTGPTMVNDHFAHLRGGPPIVCPHTWESTRFCLAPGADGRIAATLMLGGGELMRGFGIHSFIGVFDARMVRIYRRTGASPLVLGSAGQGRDRVSLGRWTYDPADRARLLTRAGVSSALSDHWFARAFCRTPDTPAPRAA